MRTVSGIAVWVVASAFLLGGCAHGGMEAASKGDLAGLKVWLAEGGQINSRGSGERTALHAAAVAGQPAAATFLLAQGADPNIVDEAGDTSLCLVMRPQKSPKEAEVTRALAAGGADVNKKCQGETPLHFAAKHYKWDALLPLLEKGAATKRKYSKADEPLCKAALSARADVVGLMLKNGEDPNRHDAAAIFDALNTPQKDSWEVVKLLVENGTNLKVKQKGDGSGDTALHRVVLLRAFGSARIVDIMVNHGADPYAVNRNQEIPLDTALTKSQDISSRMIKHMALELPADDLLKGAYDKMTMAGTSGPILTTIERMIALAGYLRVEAKLVDDDEYDEAIKDAPKRSKMGPTNRDEAEVYRGLVSYAGSLIGALANAATAGELDRAKAKDSFDDYVSTVAADTERFNTKRVRLGAGNSPAAAKVQVLVKLLKTLER